jgi:hypothetical protein
VPSVKYFRASHLHLSPYVKPLYLFLSLTVLFDRISAMYVEKLSGFMPYIVGRTQAAGCQGTGLCEQNLDLRRSDKLMDKLT